MSYYVRIGSLNGFTELVESLGADPWELLSQACILPRQLSDPDLMIPYKQVAELLEITAARLQLPYFGALLGQRQGLSTLGLIGAYMVQKPTLLQALECSAKYAQRHAQGANLTLGAPTADQCELSVNLQVNHHLQYPQVLLLSMSLIVSVFKDMLGDTWQPHYIGLKQHLPLTVKTNLEQTLKCHIQCGCRKDSMVFDAGILSQPPQPPANLLAEIIDNQFKGLRLDQPVDYVVLTRHAINMLLPTGDCSKENIAKSLDLHPKKLERLLSEQFTCYRDLLEQVRKDIAQQVLATQRPDLTNLALNLGYSEFSAFSRSFKSWFGISPTHYLQTINKNHKT
ncbi:AraC family transcriptional regulator [Pseudoalteromonas sp. T1lg75]|uniref:AraC family transcriptional regulator n=1 Tax=Pseudoalteromonas sp. T1lg75 TaxID=2077102 RepID=UPI000CF64359|nr:AraC family transcriptional regulator [Pseudoalteromonas sp. T1lg75]